MSNILCLDTSTDICSVSLIRDEMIVAFRDSSDDRSHAVNLAAFIEQILLETSMSIDQLDAVAVSKGPGSYTGLRIGVSMAKGLCYGSSIPLIAINTLESMCYGVPKGYLNEQSLSDIFYAPMLDARRMEVYTAIYDNSIKCVKEVGAEIITENSFLEYLGSKKVLFFGNGAAKTKALIAHANAIYYDDFKHSSINMIKPALKKLSEKKFEDVAYFEPFYLKDFITTTAKKNPLGI